MIRSSCASLIVWVLAAVACRGQEVDVFEFPAATSGASAGGAPDAGAAGDGGSHTAGADAAGSGGVSGSEASAGGGAGGSSAVAGGGAAASGGSGGLPAGTTCEQDSDCSPGWLCEKPGCGATTGGCEPRPVFCDAKPQPVCGCDGITYWNDCIRRQAGATFSAPEQCRATACACEVGSDCAVPNASCSHLVAPGEMCGHGTGACWLLPPACLPSGDPMHWQECRPPGAPAAPCVDTCTAIASERPHAPPHPKDACNN